MNYYYIKQNKLQPLKQSCQIYQNTVEDEKLDLVDWILQTRTTYTNPDSNF